VAKNIKGISEGEKAQINRKRLELGLPSIDRIEVVLKSKETIDRVRW
jgi:hypothetical protein